MDRRSQVHMELQCRFITLIDSVRDPLFIEAEEGREEERERMMNGSVDGA